MTVVIKKAITLGLAILWALPISALAQEAPQHRGALLNKVSYQISVEKWSTSTTANVTVAVDAALDKIGLVNINDHVLANLNKITASTNWRLIQLTRSEDKSGLEALHIEAEARLPNAVLAALRDKAKSISSPGETYTISDIDYTPSMAELNKAHADARAAIYVAAKQEIESLNQVYPDQHYFLNSIDFGGGMPGPRPQPMMARIAPQASTEMSFAGAGVATIARPGVAPSMPVSTKIVESATVVIAALVPSATKEQQVISPESGHTTISSAR